jgi:hypothetical protein
VVHAPEDNYTLPPPSNRHCAIVSSLHADSLTWRDATPHAARSRYVAWADAENLFLCYTDIVGARSIDGGASWSFNFTGHTLNTMYMALAVPVVESAADTGVAPTVLYGATSSVHDMCILWPTKCANKSRIRGRF